MNALWCLVRYLNPADHHLPRIRKKFGFKDIKCLIETKDIQKIEKKLCQHQY